jgi:hypothetical protein
MHRRTLVLAGLATLPAATFGIPVGAQRRRDRHPRRAPGTRRQQASAKPARRQTGGSLTASHIRTRIVTRTFTSTLPLTIPAAGPGPGGPASLYPSTIQVSGLTQGRTLNVRAQLIGLTHNSPGALDALLLAPDNVGVMIMSDVSLLTFEVNGIILTFDQNAPGVLPDELVTGTYQPSNFGPPAQDLLPPPAPPGVSGHSLTRLNNRNPNGLWRLFRFQDGGNQLTTGSLAGWSLQIRARVRVRPRQRRARGRTKRSPHRPSPVGAGASEGAIRASLRI